MQQTFGLSVTQPTLSALLGTMPDYRPISDPGSSLAYIPLRSRRTGLSVTTTWAYQWRHSGLSVTKESAYQYSSIGLSVSSLRKSPTKLSTCSSITNLNTRAILTWN